MSLSFYSDYRPISSGENALSPLENIKEVKEEDNAIRKNLHEI